MKYSIEQAKDIISKSIQVKSIEFIGCGNHSEAFCINNDMVIKLPKHRKASDCLKVEIQVLHGLEKKVPLDIPNVLFDGTFSAGNEEFVYFVSKRLNGKNYLKPSLQCWMKKLFFKMLKSSQISCIVCITIKTFFQSKEKIWFCCMVTSALTTYCLTIKMLCVEFLILQIAELENTKAIFLICLMTKMTKNLAHILEKKFIVYMKVIKILTVKKISENKHIEKPM